MLTVEKINDIIDEYYIELSEFKEKYLTEEAIKRIEDNANKEGLNSQICIGKIIYDIIPHNNDDNSYLYYILGYISGLKNIIK